jgi:hypothetical protein
MQSRAAETYGAVAHLWNALYDAPPPPDQDAETLFEALIGAMEPLAYDQFYQPYLRPASAPPAEAMETPLPRPARMRALDFALRSMLVTCPTPDHLRDLVEQLDQEALEAPDLRLGKGAP